MEPGIEIGIERNLLIIDDEIEITKALQRQFRKSYTIYTATNTEDAYQIMRKQVINVIISDQRMPEMTGVEFFSKIKNEFPDTVRLILTGYADVEAIVKAINDGNIFRYVSKPWNPIELDVIINEAFEKYSLIINNKHLINQLEKTNESLEEKVIIRTRELLDTNKKLEELNATKDKFFSIIAHDLKGPFTTIIGFSELLKYSYKQFDSNKMEAIIDTIYSSSNQTLELLENLLVWAQSQKGSIEFNPEIIDFRTIALDNINFVEKQATKKHIQVVMTIIQETPVFADKNMLNTVVRNLLSNAVKFTQPQGKIIIGAVLFPAYTEIFIKDTGVGIRDEILNKLFRIEANVTTKGTDGEKGTGLGLILCKEFIEKHGGRIWVESEIDNGSEFHFTLPENKIITTHK